MHLDSLSWSWHCREEEDFSDLTRGQILSRTSSGAFQKACFCMEIATQFDECLAQGLQLSYAMLNFPLLLQPSDAPHMSWRYARRAESRMCNFSVTSSPYGACQSMLLRSQRRWGYRRAKGPCKPVVHWQQVIIGSAFRWSQGKTLQQKAFKAKHAQRGTNDWHEAAVYRGSCATQLPGNGSYSGSNKAITLNFRDEEFAELSGEFSGLICLNTLVLLSISFRWFKTLIGSVRVCHCLCESFLASDSWRQSSWFEVVLNLKRSCGHLRSVGTFCSLRRSYVSISAGDPSCKVL